MKNATKSILAALSLVIVLAACSKGEKTADTQDSVQTETVAPDTTQVVAPDTTTVATDTTAAH
jgi:uncharacterized lipoprotein